MADMRRAHLALRLIALALLATSCVSTGTTDLPPTSTLSPSSSGSVRPSASAHESADGSASPARFSRVVVVVMENREYEQVIGSPDAPYINGLAQRSALATDF